MLEVLAHVGECLGGPGLESGVAAGRRIGIEQGDGLRVRLHLVGAVGLVEVGGLSVLDGINLGVMRLVGCNVCRQHDVGGLRPRRASPVSVADEGPGFPAFGPAAILGLGLRIVSSLAGAEQGTPIAVVRAVGKIVVRAPVSAH